jgi:hypothetical protein
VYENNTFEIVANHYIENPSALWFVGKGRVIDDKDNEIAKVATWYKDLLLKHISHKLLLTNNFIMQPSVFFTRKAFKKYGPFTGTDEFVMEYELWLKLCKVKRPVVINKLLSSFRIEKDTITRNKTYKLLFEDEKIVKKYTNNVLLISLHKFNNILRILINKSI